MGYPKYDKNEAKRVYEESLARHKVESDEMSRQALRGVMYLLLALATVLFATFIIVSVVKSQPEIRTITTRESVVISRIKFPPGKYIEPVIEYYTLNGIVHGEFETREIWFSVGDTIAINVSREVVVKENN